MVVSLLQGYAKIVNNCFHPTDLGVALVYGYDDIGVHLSTPALRAAMEVVLELCAYI